ncbi:MAG: type IV pilin-like G/H family protein [Xenococcaceae cyanobacterium MO_188.B32]|nr:type IV pilin-like G/H family protein [Xenococcaceae cyanobacterium MO_188.B32]
MLKMFEYLLFKKNQSLERGFTLIELLVVTIIIGILSAISMPNLLAQIGKARETEASSQLGTVGRSQQAYHFETKTFAPDMNSLGQNVAVVNGYYNFPNPTIATASIVKHQAIVNAPYDVSSRNFAVGVYFNSGEYTSVLCRAIAPTSPVTAPDTSTDPCNNSGTKIQ